MIFIGIGSNMYSTGGNSPQANCEEALLRLSQHQIIVDRTSSFYEAAPVPDTSQPWFINSVVAVTTALAPVYLLKNLLAIEAEMKRIRTDINAPRVIDLDLLVYDDQIMETTALILPHPRMTERAFVLRPLAEIAPNWQHPVSNTHISQLIENLDHQQITRPILG